jgi:O-antigen ligase
MGTGVLLALGLTVASFLMPSGKIGQWFCALLCLLAAVLTGRGLMHSYSRGAWLGAACGGAYLLWHWINARVRNTGGSEGFSRGPCISRFKRSWFPLSVVLSSAVILAFWHFRETNWHPAQRALSSVNTADFSWRNRTAAWEGALQIMAEHPWTGTAWNQPQPLYGHYYLPPKLNETGAIELNDYLTLGATVGIPALFCFGMFIWLSLKGKVESGKRKAETQGVDWLRTVCLAGAIVLLVGFWFDGGLFKLPTATTFWILLELGNVRTGETNEALNHE